MNCDQIIYKKLQEIASAATSGHTNPWPLIRLRIGQAAVSEPNQPKKFSWKFVIALVALLVVSSMAYACYRAMTDPALRAVENAGLVSHLNQTAKPTLFAPVPTQYLTTSGISQTKKGITVTLDWAYADEARLAYQLTITGLTIPKGMRSSDIICPPYLSDDEGINYNHGLGLGGGGDILDDQPGKPIVVGKDLIQTIDASKFDDLHLHLDLTIGPCSPYWNASETNITKPPPIPVIGIFHIDFQVPVYKGITFTPNQNVEAHGVTMQLESIRFNRSNIDLQLCYNLPHVPNANYEDWAIQHFAIADDSWGINEVTLQMDENKPLYGNDSPFNGLQNGFAKKHCESINFGVPSDGQPAKSVITIPELVADDDVGISTSPDWQKFARQQLTPQGIEVDFTPSGSSYWKIFKKPAGMTDSEAEQRIRDLFVHKYEGPWVFTVTKQP